MALGLSEAVHVQASRVIRIGMIRWVGFLTGIGNRQGPRNQV